MANVQHLFAKQSRIGGPDTAFRKNERESFAMGTHTHSNDSPIRLQDIGDVDATAPANQDVLVYDAAREMWSPAQAGGGGGGSTNVDSSGFVRVNPGWSNTVTTNGFTLTITRSGDETNGFGEISSLRRTIDDVVEYFITVSGRVSPGAICELQLGDFTMGVLPDPVYGIPGSFTYLPAYDGPTNSPQSIVPFTQMGVVISGLIVTKIKSTLTALPPPHDTVNDTYFIMKMHFPLMVTP